MQVVSKFVPSSCWYCGMDVSYFVWPFPSHNSKWVISRLGLSWIKLLWTFMYRFLCKQTFLVLRDKCPTILFLSHVISSCLIFFFRKLPYYFPECSWHFCHQYMNDQVSPDPWQHLVSRFILFRVSSASWICRIKCFTKFGKFSTTISLNSFSVPLSLFPSYKILIIPMLILLL